VEILGNGRSNYAMAISPNGYNVGGNLGTSVGQTVMHCQIA